MIASAASVRTSCFPQPSVVYCGWRYPHHPPTFTVLALIIPFWQDCLNLARDGAVQPNPVFLVYWGFGVLAAALSVRSLPHCSPIWLPVGKLNRMKKQMIAAYFGNFADGLYQLLFLIIW